MKRNNSYFVVCGVLEVVFSVFYAWACALFLLTFSTVSSESSGMLFMCVFVLICLAVSIFLAWLFFKHRSCTYQELHKKSGLIITGIVLSFIFGGILVGVLALVGFLDKDGTERVTVADADAQDLKTKLDELKNLLDSGQISQEEYDEMRKNLLSKF